MGHDRSKTKVQSGSMLAITQFEVYVLQHGRWILHARYSGEERHEAVLDARTTEIATGYPTKVLRETYFPEVNDSETVTAYISPKAKTARVAPPPATPFRAAANALARRRGTRAVKAPMSVSNLFFRVIVAGGLSLAAATLMTGLVNWILNQVSGDRMPISSETATMVLTYSYVVLFLLFFFSLFRSRLPLHRLLADLWQKSTKSSADVAAATARSSTPPKVRPKHARPPSPESLREFEDMKLKRGDLDAAKPPEIIETPVAVVAGPEVAPPPTLEPDKAAEKAAEKAAKKAAAEKAGAEKAATEKAAAEKAAAEKAKAAEKKQKPEELAPESSDAPREEAGFENNLNLERMVMRRFANDVVKPAIVGTMPDDPVARRGAALALAGAAAGVAATARLGPAAEVELLTDAQRHMGTPQATIDLFMGQYAEHTAAPANTLLVAAGRNAVVAYLEGAADVVTVIARALAAWRTPFGQPSPTMLGSSPSPAPFSATPADALPLIEAYLLTELREEHIAPAFDETPASNAAAEDASHDQAMGMHNGIVRTVLANHSGHEVKHTGKGIFARFTTARAAIDAAVEMERQFAAAPSGPKVAIGIIGNTTAGEDPILSPNLIRQAQAVIVRARGGEILCEPQVHAAVERQAGAQNEPGDQASSRAEEIDLVRVVAGSNTSR